MQPLGAVFSLGVCWLGHGEVARRGAWPSTSAVWASCGQPGAVVGSSGQLRGSPSGTKAAWKAGQENGMRTAADVRHAGDDCHCSCTGPLPRRLLRHSRANFQVYMASTVFVFTLWIGDRRSHDFSLAVGSRRPPPLRSNFLEVTCPFSLPMCPLFASLPSVTSWIIHLPARYRLAVVLNSRA